MNIDVLLAILKKKYCKSSAIPSFQDAQLAEGLLLRNKFLQQLFVLVEAVGIKQILRQKRQRNISGDVDTKEVSDSKNGSYKEVLAKEVNKSSICNDATE